MSSYRDEARNDAKETISNFEEEILEQLHDKGEASDDLLNDYCNGDAWHHENHVDKSYRLTEAAELLDELSDCEETDSGLWEGLAPRDAISAQAAYTYGNAVYSEFQDLIREINSDAECIIEDYDEKIQEAEEAADEDEDEDENLDVETLEDEKKDVLRKLIREAVEY